MKRFFIKILAITSSFAISVVSVNAATYTQYGLTYSLTYSGITGSSSISQTTTNLYNHVTAQTAANSTVVSIDSKSYYDYASLNQNGSKSSAGNSSSSVTYNGSSQVTAVYNSHRNQVTSVYYNVLFYRVL